LRQKFAAPPLLPFDLFAITGYLLQLSGAYHHVTPAVAENDLAAGPVITGTRQATGVTSDSRTRIAVSSKTLRRCREEASRWRKDLPESEGDFATRSAARSKELIELWRDWDALVGAYGNAPVFSGPLNGALDRPPEWWDCALRLFITADEASVEVGFALEEKNARGEPFTPPPQPWFERLVLGEFAIAIKRLTTKEKLPIEADDVRSVPWIQSLSLADKNVVCVLPKARTTAVGFTLRSLSHHLALVPPQGVVQGRWVPYVFGNPPADEWELNILLVPFPYTITPESFLGGRSFFGESRRWGFFGLQQTWLDSYGDPDPRDQMLSQLVEFVTELVDCAKTEHKAKSINAVVFPEMALDHRIFRGLADRLSTRLPHLELLIAGVSHDEKRVTGNFVAARVFQRTDHNAAPQPNPRMALDSIREKHHRWKLDGPQLKAYGLDSVLNPKLTWWENINLANRSVDFTVFRWGSVLATLICEDLARVDPCQELVRAVGPNIVIALLMDAPQLITRWPARYATILAEDPGSAVLTLTSRGLMTHQHVQGIQRSKSKQDRVIALWRDATGDPIEITCPNDAHGVWLKIWGGPDIDTTIDGREDHTPISWQYGLHRPLSIQRVDARYGKLVGVEDTSLRELPSAEDTTPTG
jgi:hypothetical protein